MKINKIVKEDPVWTFMMSFTETRRVADLLEQSNDFEEKIIYLRNKYKIPDSGYPFAEKAEEYNPDYAMEIVLDDNTLDSFFEESSRITKELGLPRYWWGSIAYFAFHNVLITPERVSVAVEYIESDQNWRSGTHIIISEKMSKTELHKWVDMLWEEIEKEMEQLPSLTKHKMQRSEIAKKVAEMKDSKGMKFRQIADELQKEYQDSDFYDALNENNLKTLYHRWKSMVSNPRK